MSGYGTVMMSGRFRLVVRTVRASVYVTDAIGGGCATARVSSPRGVGASKVRVRGMKPQRQPKMKACLSASAPRHPLPSP